MTPTSDERIEIAARLRKTRRIMDFVYALGIDFLGDWCWTDVSRCVADIIDPTCQMKSIPESGYHVCSRCGAFVRRDAATSCTEVIPVRFCPNCGARVVMGGEG